MIVFSVSSVHSMRSVSSVVQMFVIDSWHKGRYAAADVGARVSIAL